MLPMDDRRFSAPAQAGRRMLPKSPEAANQQPPSSPSGFKTVANVAIGANRIMASGHWTQARRRSKTEEVMGPTRSAILAHMPRPRSNSVIVDPQEERPRRRLSVSPVVIKQLSSNSLAAKLGLNATQNRAIQVSWQRLESLDGHKGAKAVLERAFTALCAKQPAMSMIFVSNSCIQAFSSRTDEVSVRTLRDHARFCAWFLGKVVEGLDDDAKPMLDMIKDYGKAHGSLASIGLKSKMWDKLGQVLVEHLVVQEGVRHYPEATKAWTVLTASLIDRLCSAFVQECKRK